MLVAAVTFRDPPVAALGLACLIYLVVGMALDARSTEAAPDLEATTQPEIVRAGTDATVVITFRSKRPVRLLLASIELPSSFRRLGATAWSTSVPPDGEVRLSAEVTPRFAGQWTVGPIVCDQTGPHGLLLRRSVIEGVDLDVRAAEERLRALPRTAAVRVPAGERLARRHGDGIELAEVRPRALNEPVRRINWRATARRGSIHVTLHHPEQSTDVILFADTFDSPHLDRVLAATSTAAAAYLSRRDRVGLVCFGGVLDWVEPATGNRQLDRIRARLASTSPFFSYAWKTLERIPPRALPPGALVVATSPLRDERYVAAIADMRSKGHDVVVVQLVDRPAREHPGESAYDTAARHLAALEQEELLHRLFVRGISVIRLEPGEPLERAFFELTEARRHARMVQR